MKLLKLCISEWDNASRDKRELSVCRELGYEVLVMAKGKSRDKFKKDFVDGFNVYRFSTRPLGRNIPIGINRTVSIINWAYYAKKFQVDVISCHDLIALLIGYLSNVFRTNQHKAMLVYDSHEFELGRNAKRNKLQLFFIRHLEKFLMKRCVFSIMVNDCIADEVQRIHRLKQRPIVVRSTPNLWAIDPQTCLETREMLMSKFDSGGRSY